MSNSILERAPELEAVAAPARQFEPRPMKWTDAQYEAMIAAGYFQDRRVELIDGEILEMSPMLEPHALTLMRVQEWCYQAFPTKEFGIRSQMPFFVEKGYRPEPDLLVVRKSLLDGKFPPSTATLLIEISDSTLNYDRTIKASLYAKAGISEYWIFNIADKVLEIRSAPKQDSAAQFNFSFGMMETHGVGEAFSSPLAPETPILLTEIFS